MNKIIKHTIGDKTYFIPENELMEKQAQAKGKSIEDLIIMYGRSLQDVIMNKEKQLKQFLNKSTVNSTLNIYRS